MRVKLTHPVSLLVGFVVLAVCAIAFVDREFALWCKGFAASMHPVVRTTIELLNEAGEGKYWVLASAACFILLAVFKQHNLARWSFAMLASVGLSGLLVNALKLIFGRYRPDLLHKQGQYGFEFFQFSVGYDTMSFPSGHATTIASVCMVLWYMLPKWRVVWVLLWMGVLAARLLATAHFLGDVLAGSALGASVALLVLRIWRRRFAASVPVALNS
ncbi:MAG: phosphatase PAP2 family protein [Phycisphaerales bacterium]|nr:phosphatase PAP2 family protein [Phycisphaerales bacterium]